MNKMPCHISDGPAAPDDYPEDAPQIDEDDDRHRDPPPRKKKRNWIENPPHCRHCWGEGRLVSGERVYPHLPHLHHLRFWLCEPCNAYVGVHSNSQYAAPKGLMALPKHRGMKMRAHQVFDQLWKSGHMTRPEAYKWLQKAMGESRPVHIGWSTIEELEAIVAVCEDYLSDPFSATDSASNPP